MADIKSNIPAMPIPFSDKEGVITYTWYRFLETLFNRTGGINGDRSGNLETRQTQLELLIDALTARVDTAESNITDLQTNKADLDSPTFTGTPAAPTAAHGTDTTQLATTAFVQDAIAYVGFSATKGGTDQTGFSSAVFAQVTFATEEWDIGGYYDASTSKWTPPAGYVRVTANVRLDKTNLDNTAAVTLQIYKNGVALKQSMVLMQNDTRNLSYNVDITDLANGTDVYEARINPATTSGTATVLGAVNATYFQGQLLAPS